ncbi:hypothetical protein D9758_011133 [Tetrapyrgos nigripes]|uniref:MULE transposase domain-containing protein n=1 Tax=Tetrapyrgos nigripes TaxID=182062 RepID=A0A8H5CLV6_9AGAR|nr:hypothetical protein D9758_011133 [Tetrapyrgos nigripes]
MDSQKQTWQTKSVKKSCMDPAPIPATSTSEPSLDSPANALANANGPDSDSKVFDADEFVGLGVIHYESLFQKLPDNNKAYSFTAIVDLTGLTDSERLQEKADDFVALFWEKTQMRFEYEGKYSHINTPSTRFKYSCAQTASRQSKPAKHTDVCNRDKGSMDTFDCQGWLHITVFEDSEQAFIKFKHHKDHCDYPKTTVPDDIQHFVEDNFKMSTSALWSEILGKFPNPAVHRRDVYAIANAKKSQRWKRDPDEVKSAKILLEESSKKSNDSGNHYTIEAIDLSLVEGYIGLAFTLPDVLLKWGGQIREILLDSACKILFDLNALNDNHNLFIPENTNGSHYELYALIGELYGSGCPLGYLLLQSPTEGKPGAKEKYIHSFLEHFKVKHDLKPIFTLTDKDLSKINAFLKAFPQAKHQLCFWHALRAVKSRLSVLRRSPKYYDVKEARNEFGDEIDKNFVPVGQVSEAERVNFVVSQTMIPRVTIRIGGVLQNTAPPKPRLTIRLKPLSEVTLKSSKSMDQSGDLDEDEIMDDPAFDKLLDDTETDEEFGSEYMFDADEKCSKDPSYVFCPAPHRKQLLHLFTRHFCQHPIFPECFQTESMTSEEIRRNAVLEMYQFCYVRGLREVWGYMWTSWYCPKMWRLWARSAGPDYLSHLRTTMNVENFWKQLKHDNLHHLLHPRLDQLVWILIHEVTPSYMHCIAQLESTFMIGKSQPLTNYQRYFKTDWKKLLSQPASKRADYATDVYAWICNCRQQKYNRHCLCKHLVQAVGLPSPRFFQHVIQRRTCPIYCHPELVPLNMPPRMYSDMDDGSITDGDDQIWLGDKSQLIDGQWRELTSGSVRGTKRRASSVSRSSPELGASTGASSPIGYGSDGEDIDKDIEYATDLIETLRNAANIIEAQIPHKNRLWLKSLHTREIGRDISHFVKDVREFESPRGNRETTWARKQKGDNRRVANTMGYQIEGSSK